MVFGWPDGAVKSGERDFSACAERLVLVRDTCPEVGEVDDCEGRLAGLGGTSPLWSWECESLSHQMYNDKPVREQRERMYGTSN
jgi:hypothetical protein